MYTGIPYDPKHQFQSTWNVHGTRINPCHGMSVFDSNQVVQNFWTNHTEILADTKPRIPEFLELAQIGCQSQNTSYRISGMYTGIPYHPKHQFQSIWNVQAMSVFEPKQVVQKFWTNHTEILADTKPRIPEFLELAQIGCQSQNTSYRISGMYTGIPYHPKHQFQIQSIWNVHEMSVFDSKTTGPEILDQSHRNSG
ncbi:hypothetical protein FisN_20Hu044 [Fistulifera solaris]|uniref:Uncharacterized protein n=1 Tax=Fistulifera solaris TaxID=1519565 RepID=A0A1Z5KCM6_FISSO|nr:hypothetical protein FisN_20Hu044 [Fistulifera solaris]|eukprot:GAX23841.1 hypothetical protein FisN_20Hu044 [Fistulifera solaris]